MNALARSPVVGRPRVERRGVDSSGHNNFQSVLRPLLIADWLNALFLHYEIEPERLQPFVPFELDLWNGRAAVSLVAFTMSRMRFARLGVLGEWLCKPIGTHEFLNLRTYVRHRNDAGICFLSEWLPNRLSVCLGPAVYALPYRYARIRYKRNELQLRGVVAARSGRFQYEGKLRNSAFAECTAGSFGQFLLERYSAFNSGHFSPDPARKTRRCFRVWHEPWPQVEASVGVRGDSLLQTVAPWWRHARFAGANYSPGVRNVRMSAPQRVA